MRYGTVIVLVFLTLGVVGGCKSTGARKAEANYREGRELVYERAREICPKAVQGQAIAGTIADGVAGLFGDEEEAGVDFVTDEIHATAVLLCSTITNYKPPAVE